ncbi:MAG: hypothetical protein JWO58_505 [Chitinophagaceae bacterium]|nr:hypothetical protein [Chitinophagaceae bacterium]
MILFTGSGFLATEYKKKYPCQIISARFLTDIELESVIEKSDVIIHNAADVNCVDFDQCIQDNFLFTKRVLDLASRVNPTIRFIFISSMSILETTDSYKDINSMSLYAFSKYLSEIFCLKHPYHNNIVSVRFSTIFYKNHQKDGLSKLIRDAFFYKKVTIYNEGISKRDFIPINIAVEYLQKIIANKKIKGRVNIVSGHPQSFIELVEVLKKKLAFEIENVKMEGMLDILSDFSKESINALGQIDFDIEREMNSYLDQLGDEGISI